MGGVKRDYYFPYLASFLLNLSEFTSKFVKSNQEIIFYFFIYNVVAGSLSDLLCTVIIWLDCDTCFYKNLFH